jgi:hypothetical protein
MPSHGPLKHSGAECLVPGAPVHLPRHSTKYVIMPSHAFPHFRSGFNLQDAQRSNPWKIENHSALFRRAQAITSVSSCSLIVINPNVPTQLPGIPFPPMNALAAVRILSGSPSALASAKAKCACIKGSKSASRNPLARARYHQAKTTACLPCSLSRNDAVYRVSCRELPNTAAQPQALRKLRTSRGKPAFQNCFVLLGMELYIVRFVRDIHHANATFALWS